MPPETPPAAPGDVFEELFQRYYDRVLAYALCRAERDQALDAAAETFLVVWRRLGDVPAEPLPWLLGVARRVLSTQRRAAGRQANLAGRLAAVPPSIGRDPGDEVAASVAIRAALGRLGDADRELLMLLAWDGLTTREAAESLGCSIPAVSIRLHRARRRLERELGRQSATAQGADTRSPERSFREVS
jgi:RNA polymerase sigma-70 factor (ECF subfamily)